MPDTALPVLAADSWPTNGHLIRDVARLHLKDVTTLDPTYGKGKWWTLWRPTELVCHDLKLDGVDFRHLPYDANSFAQIAFDPPYVAKGGRATSGIKEMDAAYGIDVAPRTPIDLQLMIDDGITECARVLASQGILLVKTMNYVSSGRYWPGAIETLKWALHCRLELVDQFIHVGHPGPQPPGRRQVHARNNASILYVMRKP